MVKKGGEICRFIISHAEKGDKDCFFSREIHEHTPASLRYRIACRSGEQCLPKVWIACRKPERCFPKVWKPCRKSAPSHCKCAGIPTRTRWHPCVRKIPCRGFAASFCDFTIACQHLWTSFCVSAIPCQHLWTRLCDSAIPCQHLWTSFCVFAIPCANGLDTKLRTVE